MKKAKRNAIIFGLWFALALLVIGLGGAFDPLPLTWRLAAVGVSAAAAALICMIGTLHALGERPRFPIIPPL